MTTPVAEQIANLAPRLDRSTDVPLYAQFATHLEEMIEQRVLAPGDRLPSSVELTELAGLTIGTVSKAMAQLTEKGLVARRRRLGTFVTEPPRPPYANIGYYYLQEREPVMLHEVEAIHRALSPHRLDVKLIPFGWDFFQHVDLLEDVRQRALTGAVFTVLSDPACRLAMQALERAGFPHVRLGNRVFEEELRSPLVAADDDACMAQTFERLRQHGHTRIGFLGGAPDSVMAALYHQRATASGEFRPTWRLPLRFDGPLVVDTDRLDAEPLPQLVRGYLHENPELTAVLVWHPLVGQHLMEQAEQLDRRVPERLSVISLRNGAPFGVPTPCSAWSLDARHMGRLAAEHLRGVMRNESVPPRSFIPWQFVDRGSVASAAAPAMAASR